LQYYKQGQSIALTLLTFDRFKQKVKS